MPEQFFNVSHGIKVGVNTIHDNVVFDPVPDTDSKYTSSAIDVSANKKGIRLAGSGATTGNQDITFAGGNAVTLTRSGNEISIASTDTDTTYTTSVVDGTSNKKIIRLTAGGAGSGTDDVTLVAGTNISLTRSSDEITITGANEADTLTSVTDRGAATTNDLTVASLTATGNINCAGTITYEDVTSVDSVGIITARQGLNVTGNVTVTGTVDGRDVASDGTKLDGIASGAEVNVKSDWNSTTGDNEILNKPTNVSAFTNDAGYVTTAFVAGMIMLWSGSSGSIPAGWLLCDGGGGRPDLRDRFVIGAGAGYNVNATGGAATVTLTTSNLPAHSHTTPNHSHSYSGSGTTGGGGSHDHGGNTTGGGSHSHDYNTRTLGSVHSYGDSNQTRPNNSTTSTNTGDSGSHAHNVTGNTGSDGSHAHNISGSSSQNGESAAGKNMPPWYALCYIIKT